jgi:hypothetical protein
MEDDFPIFAVDGAVNGDVSLGHLQAGTRVRSEAAIPSEHKGGDAEEHCRAG